MVPIRSFSVAHAGGDSAAPLGPSKRMTAWKWMAPRRRIAIEYIGRAKIRTPECARLALILHERHRQ
jgi:hypothetical protein